MPGSGLIVGCNSGSYGTYQLNGAGYLTSALEYVGNSGTGTFTHSAGTNTASAGLLLGYAATGSGTYYLQGTAYLGSAEAT